MTVLRRKSTMKICVSNGSVVILEGWEEHTVLRKSASTPEGCFTVALGQPYDVRQLPDHLHFGTSQE